MDNGHVEFSGKIKFVGPVVFAVLCIVGFLALSLFTQRHGPPPAKVPANLLIIGISGAIALFVHASIQLLLYPYAVYKIRRFQGDTPLQAALYFLRFLLISLAFGAIGLVLAGMLNAVLGPFVFVLCVLAAWQWDKSRRKIRTIDVLSQSRDLTTK